MLVFSSLEDNSNGDDIFISYLLRAYSYCIFELSRPPPRRPFWYHPAYVQNLRRYCFQLQLHSKSICFIRSLKPAGSVHVSVHRYCVHPLIFVFRSVNEFHWNLIIFAKALWDELTAIMLLVSLKKAFEHRRRRAQLRIQRTNLLLKPGYTTNRFKTGQFTEAVSWFWVWTCLLPVWKGKDCPPGWSAIFK